MEIKSLVVWPQAHEELSQLLPDRWLKPIPTNAGKSPKPGEKSDCGSSCAYEYGN